MLTGTEGVDPQAGTISEAEGKTIISSPQRDISGVPVEEADLSVLQNRVFGFPCLIVCFTFFFLRCCVLCGWLDGWMDGWMVGWSSLHMDDQPLQGTDPFLAEVGGRLRVTGSHQCVQHIEDVRSLTTSTLRRLSVHQQVSTCNLSAR